MARQDVGVHLYSRKVLIQSRCETLLPEWMRFFKGVVDSEDLPLNISRETMQDSALMRKLSTVLAKRGVKFLQERAKVDKEAYLSFYLVPSCPAPQPARASLPCPAASAAFTHR